LIWFCGVA